MANLNWIFYTVPPVNPVLADPPTPAFYSNYDAGLRNNKINATTGVCIGYAVNADQGQGYSFIMNRTNPEAWIWPEPQSDPLQIMDTKNQVRYIVLDEITGHYYELGTRDGPKNSGLVSCYQDKADGSYAGAEIPCGLKLREHVGRAEHEFITHVETHAYMRPQSEENKGATGYTSTGYRPALEVEIRGYKKGDLVENARAKKIPFEGDIVFDREIKDHRVQIGFFTTASQFRLAGLDQYYLIEDESASRKAMSEHGWQDEFSEPFLWITRGNVPLINRTTAQILTGDYFDEVDGPDNKDESAIFFTPTTGTVFGPETLSDDFTIIFSIKDAVLPWIAISPLRIYQSGGTTYLSITANGHTDTQALSWNNSGWVTLMVKREGDNIVFGENGTIIGSFLDLLGTVSMGVVSGDEWKAFNIMCFDSAISDDAWEYFYDDLTENNGDALLPLW